jgi:cytochrome c oxidase cbb3-type subunit III
VSDTNCRSYTIKAISFGCAAVMLVGASCTFVFSAQHAITRSKMPQKAGRTIFASTCAGCHGLDGRGSERAPDIAKKREIQRLSDPELVGIVRDGVPGTGMPAFHSLSIAEIKSVVAYLRVLQGNNKPATLPGDPERGGVLFAKAGCLRCHTVAGKGGFIAADLSSYGHTHSLTEIRNAIAHRNESGEIRSVLVSTRDGQKYSGRIRNEDNFSLQLQTLDGTFYFFSKSEIERVEDTSPSFLPSDYNSSLSSKELDDIVSYLVKSARTRNSEKPAETND